MGSNYNTPPAAAIFGMLIAGLLVILAFGPVALAFGLIYLVKKLIDWYRMKEAANEESAAEDEVTQQVTDKKYRKHVDVGDAAVDVWFHPETSVAKRTIKIRDKALAEQLGSNKLKLSDVEFLDPNEVDAIVAQTISEVKAKLEGKGAKIVAPEAPAKPAKAKAKQKTVEKGTSTPRVVNSHTGRIISFGVEEKEGKGDRKGNYHTFCLQIHDQQAGAPREMCGVELQRAVKNAGVKPGDLVRVDFHGKTLVSLPNEESAYKNLWSVQKV